MYICVCVCVCVCVSVCVCVCVCARTRTHANNKLFFKSGLNIFIAFKQAELV